MGLVSISDLQRLPVRAALFALITGFEMIMADFIRQRYSEDGDWLKLLADKRQRKIEDEKSKAKADDSYVDMLLFTQFCDKKEIVKLPFLDLAEYLSQRVILSRDSNMFRIPRLDLHVITRRVLVLLDLDFRLKFGLVFFGQSFGVSNHTHLFRIGSCRILMEPRNAPINAVTTEQQRTPP